MKRKIFCLLVLTLIVTILCACGPIHKHTFDQGVENGDNLVYTCSVCDYKKTEKIPHEHTFSEEFTSNETHHWYQANCGHNLKQLEEEHVFDLGQLNNDYTQIVYTCQSCKYQKNVEHVHEYQGDWIIVKDATIFQEGSEYRNCTNSDCKVRQNRVVEKEKVVEIQVTVSPNKTTYVEGESFDSTGIVVVAKGSNGSKTDVTTLVTYDKTTLALDDTVVVVAFEGKTAQIPVVVEKLIVALSVNQVRNSTIEDEVVFVEGYFVGVADEGYNFDKEILLKDLTSDDVIAVHGLPASYGTFPNVGYQYGDLVRLYVKPVKEVYDSAVSNSQNKIFLEFDTEKNPTDINQTIVSKNNNVTYKYDQIVELEEWAEWKKVFSPNTLQAYTYVRIVGKVYLNTYTANDGISIIRVTANGAASALKEIKPDGARALGFRQNVLEQNLGEKWRELFDYPEDCPSKTFPGYEKQVEIVAIVTATNSVNYQLTVLCADWVDATPPVAFEYTPQQALYEVAYAFHRQGNQAKYNQKNSRREPTSSPEDATEQDVLVLDCSSYANSVYHETFGTNLLPTSVSPSTANYISYAKSNVGKAADVVGYWENKDYTTQEEQQALLDQIRSNLQVGDCVVYRHGKTSGTSGHVMVYVGNNIFLHSTGTDYNHASDPTKSYDKKTAGEQNEGTVQILSADAVFTPNSSTPKRYLFYTTEADSTFSFCVLRPIARGLVPTNETQNRMSLQGVDMEKSIDVGAYNTIYNNSQVTYTLRITNTSNTNLTGVTFNETLPQCCTFVGSQDGVSLSTGKLVWTGDVAKNSTVNVSYTVKVAANQTQAMVVSSGKVNGVNLNVIYNTISYKTQEQMQKVAQVALNYGNEGANFENPTEFVKTVYDQALGLSLFDYTTVSSALTDVIDTSTNLRHTDTAISQMVAGYLYGGLDISAGWQTETARVRLVEKANLAVGDVIIAEKGSMSMSAIYLGEGKLVVIYSTTDVCQVVDASNENYYKSGSYYILDTVIAQLITYDRYAVLRPSVVANQTKTLTRSPKGACFFCQKGQKNKILWQYCVAKFYLVLTTV